MAIKLLAAVLAFGLMLAYLLPPVFKLKEVALGVVVAIGLVMMAIDLRQSLKD